MSDASEKPFEPTPRRIVKARREGNVARSGELAANLSFAAAAMSVAAMAPLLGAVACNAMAASVSGQAGAADGCVLGVALGPISAAAVAGAIGSWLQTGGPVLQSIAPKLERLNPIDGVKRILSRETLAHSLRAALAFACAVGAMSPLLARCAWKLLQAATPGTAADEAWSASREVAIAAATVGCVFAFAEFAAARNLWLRKLRMSFAERKREAREEEGDAAARGRRRALHRTLLASGMQRLNAAALVVANPQHLAIALEYRPPRVPVPMVLVRAAGADAVRVRRIAAAYRIPIVEDVSLARALYRDAQVGAPIPPAHYVAVAQVVAALQRHGLPA